MAPDEYDDVVVGAGIVGLTTALLLARAGHRVAVVTAEPVGGGSSGRSAGVVSQLHGLAYRRFSQETARKNAAAYRAANADGFALLTGLLDAAGTPYERRDALLVARTPDGARRIDDEHLAARRAGLQLEKRQRADLPFDHYGALRLPDQILVDPGALLTALAIAARTAGVDIRERERVIDVRVRPGGVTGVETDAGEIGGHHVVLATGTPILDRGLYLLKTQAYRMIALAGDGVDAGTPIVTSVGPGGSMTSAVTSAGRATVFGAAHPVGDAGRETHLADALGRRAAETLPGFVRDAVWSGQDYRPYNPIAFVGALPRGGGAVSFATGFDGWGLTNGAAAAIRLAAERLRTPPPAWATTISRRVTRPASQRVGLAGGITLAARRVGGARRVTPADLHLLADGDGIVHRTDAGLVATSRVDGVVASVSAQCTRGGGVVKWNDLELSWDCPVCGSRFSPDGAVLEGGARGPLPSAASSGAS